MMGKGQRQSAGRLLLSLISLWLSVNRDFFMQNLLGKSYEKILLPTSINFRGDYHDASPDFEVFQNK